MDPVRVAGLFAEVYEQALEGSFRTARKHPRWQAWVDDAHLPVQPQTTLQRPANLMPWRLFGCPQTCASHQSILNWCVPRTVRRCLSWQRMAVMSR